jgi:hypothetical protein
MTEGGFGSSVSVKQSFLKGSLGNLSHTQHRSEPRLSAGLTAVLPTRRVPRDSQCAVLIIHAMREWLLHFRSLLSVVLLHGGRVVACFLSSIPRNRDKLWQGYNEAKKDFPHACSARYTSSW